MSKQRKTHEQALKHIFELEKAIDRLKGLGPCPLDGENALKNVAQWLDDLRNRTGVKSIC